MRVPHQKALKLPATIPERMVSEAPPSRETVTISCTCLEWELGNSLVNSGISTAASVPQLMMVASCHHNWGSWVTLVPALTDRSPKSNLLIRKEVEMHKTAAIQIRRVRGCSKLNSPKYSRVPI